MNNTRFNPTTNGPLHIGHVYLCLLNQQIAHDNGGKFIVRFADNESYWVQSQGKQAMADIAKEMQDDLAWAGVEPDIYTWQSEHEDEDKDFIKDLTVEHISEMPIILPADPTQITDYSEVYISPKTKITPIAAPYMSYDTALKVAQDYREGCDLIVRGEELITEFSLYIYFCRLLKIRIPKHIYVPRLKYRDFADLSDISKSKGNLRIKDFREHGYSSSAVISLLKESCLVDPNGDWTFNNLKKQPFMDNFPWPDLERWIFGYESYQSGKINVFPADSQEYAGYMAAEHNSHFIVK